LKKINSNAQKSNMKYKKCKVALIQYPPVYLNLAESIKRACSLIEKAATNGAKIIVFPETWLPGYPVWLDFSPKAGLWDHPPAKALYRILVENSITVSDQHVKKLSKIAKETGSYVIMGAHERDGGTLYNSIIFIHKNGREVAVHRKLMPTYTERMIWGRGDGSTLSTMKTEYGVLGGLICWEHWMPLARAAMHCKQVAIHVAQWPMVKEMNVIASRHYAFEGGCFVLAAGAILTKKNILEGFDSIAPHNSPARDLLQEMVAEGNIILKGGSCVIAPNGEFVHKPVYEKSEIFYAELNLELITENRLFLDADGHYSRPDIFKLHVNDKPQKNVTFDS